jgi:hypothetical protein
MHERQRHELGEPAAAILNRGERAQMREPMHRRVDVPVHHRAGRRDAEAMRALDDRNPLRRRQFSLGENPSDVVVEDLRRRAWQAVDAGE